MKKIVPIILLLSLSSFADDFSDFQDDETSKKVINFSGFISIEQGAFTKSKTPLKETNDDYSLAKKQVRVELDKNVGNTSINAKIDLIQDDVVEKSEMSIRELKISFSPFESTDISIGKQVSTWGVSDMLFINDLFAKNWNANFTGQEMEYLKDSSASFRSSTYLANTLFDFVYTPKFSPDTTPTGCALPTFDANTKEVVMNKTSCGENNNAGGAVNNSSSNGEYALQIKKDIAGISYALYGYQGHYKNPRSMQMTGSSLAAYYPKLNVWGASIEGQVGPGIFTFETGYYDSKEDQNGTNYLIENSMLKYLIGYRLDLTSSLSVGAQWYVEHMQDYDKYKSSAIAMGDLFAKKERQNTYTLRVTYKAQQETLLFSLFSYIRPEDHDSFTKFEVSKKVSNDFLVAAGANVFTGKDNYRNREFGMLDSADNAFFRLKYTF